MTPSAKKAVHVEPMLTNPVRHPIKAAKLLYTMPSYLLSAPIYLIFIILIVAIIYAFWAKQDVLVMAPLVLEKDNFTLQATGQGQVIAVAAQANSFVEAGTELAVIQEQIRPFDNAQRDAVEGQLVELERERDKQVNEYEHELSQLESELEDLTINRETNIKSFKNRITILEEQLATTQSAMQVNQEALSIAERQYKTESDLLAQGMSTRPRQDDALQRRNIARQRLVDTKAQILEIESQLDTTKAELNKFEDLRQQQRVKNQINQTQTRRERDLTRLDEQIQSLNNRLNAASYQEGTIYEDNKARYTSLFDGVITEVHVSPGQMVSPGAPLVTMVRESTLLEGHAYVENKDIGKLKRGQEVKIKYFAYPYQEYGIATGLISSIATTPGGPAGKESMYRVNVILRDDMVRPRGRAPKPLEIGLEGIAEIKTGERRFIEIIFTPISKFFAAEEESA